jgi:hypothetical protein
MVNNDPLQDVEVFVAFVKRLKERTALLRVEKYDGFFDLANVQNFLQDYMVLEDLYPKLALRQLRSYINDFTDWRPEAVEDEAADYTIYGQAIRSHTFSEMAERIFVTGSGHLILNLGGHNLPDPIPVAKGHLTCELSSVSTTRGLHRWFSEHRQPSRDFQITNKHGENRQDIRGTANKPISPLRCSKEQAHQLLHRAVGTDERELFFLDQQYNQYIVFRYEGDNPQQMYHGYHVALTTDEVSEELKRVIAELLEE